MKVILRWFQKQIKIIYFMIVNVTKKLLKVATPDSFSL